MVTGTLRQHWPAALLAASALLLLVSLGLVFGAGTFGTVAEWAAGIATVAAVIAALGLANRSTRESQRSRYLERQAVARRWNLDLALRLLTLVESDRRTALETGDPAARSPEAIATARVLYANAVGLARAWWYYGETVEFGRFLTLDLSRPDGLAMLWDEIQDDVLQVIAYLSAPDRAPMEADEG